MAGTRTYAVGNGGTVVRLDAHIGPWINITPVFLNSNETTWYDVMTDPLDSDKVTIVGDNNLGGIGSGILVSTDAGANWNIPGGNWNTGDPILLKELWYADSNVIWAVGINGKVVQSLDAGLTFNFVARVDVSLDSQTAAIHAIDAFTAIVGGGPQTGFSATRAYAWLTTDGGLSWNILNGGLSLSAINPFNPVGGVGGIWISDDLIPRIVVSTWNTQNISTDGGLTFTSLPVEMVESGQHLTWFPAHDPNPATMRHTGGLLNQVNESLDNGATWNITRNGDAIEILAAQFYTITDGYYTVSTDIFSTSDGAVTGVLSYSEPSGNPFQAVWTGNTPGTPPDPCPCYLITDCNDPLNTILITTDCTIDTPYNPLLPNVTYQFTVPGAQDIPGCWTAEVADCAGGIPQEVVVSAAWQDCIECLNPLVPNVCFDLEVVCDGPCDDIFAINGFDFTPFIGQNITIQPPLTDPECWYTPYALRQAVFIALPQSAGGGYNLSWPFGAFQQGTDDLTISIPSFILNGVEQIQGSPPTNLVTPANIQFVNCQNMTCTNVPLNFAGGLTGYANMVDFINTVFSSLGILYMQAFNNSFDNCPITIIKPRETFRLQYRDGDTFTLQVTLSNIGQGVQTFTLQVSAGNITTNFNVADPTTEFPTCNDNIWCLTDPADSPQILGATVMGDCPVTPIDLGEACEIVPRLGEPGFSTKNCDPKKVIDVKCKFADSVYAQFKRARYGIDTCCEYDLDKIDIKNQLIDLGELYDPELCVSGTPLPDDCCLQPCNAVAELFINLAVPCPAPTGPVITDLTIPSPPFAACNEMEFSIAPAFGIISSIAGVGCCGTPFNISIQPGQLAPTLCVDANEPLTLTPNITATIIGDCDCCPAPTFINDVQFGRGVVSIPGSNCMLVEFIGINDLDNTIVGTECDGTPINTAVFPGAIPLVLCVDLDLPYAVGNNVQTTGLGICS